MDGKRNAASQQVHSNGEAFWEGELLLTWHTYGERNAASQVLDIKLYGVSTKTAEVNQLKLPLQSNN